MTIETNERRDFLKTLVRVSLAGVSTIALATQAQAEQQPKKRIIKKSNQYR